MRHYTMLSVPCRDRVGRWVVVGRRRAARVSLELLALLRREATRAQGRYWRRWRRRHRGWGLVGGGGDREHDATESDRIWPLVASRGRQEVGREGSLRLGV